MDEETLVHVYNGILLSRKGNNIGSFVVSQMDLAPVIQSECFPGGAIGKKTCLPMQKT